MRQSCHLRALLPLLALAAVAGAANSVSSIKWKNTDFIGVATADVHLPVVEGELLMLSKGIPNGAAAAWLAHPHIISNGFSLSFSFRALVAESMDGFAVVFQSDPAQSRALGGAGESLGYAGLKSSVAIELDCFKNPELKDPDGNHMSVHTMKAQPNDAHEARPMQVAGGLANRQCSKTTGNLPCLPVFTDSQSHTVQLVYTSSGPSDTESVLKIFVNNKPQPVLTTFINIDECAVSSADHLLYIGFTVGKGQLAGPVILENVSFAPSGSVMTMSTLVILCAFAFLMAFLQGSLSFWRNKASLRKEHFLYQPLHGRDQDGDGKDGDLCRLQMQQWLRGNFSYSSGREGDSVPHDIGFRGSKSMVRVSAMADGSPKLVVCVRLTKAHAQLLKDTPGGTDTLLEVLSHFSRSSYFFEPLDTCSFTADSSVLLLVRPWRRSGSLRDFLFHCNPENSFKEKYDHAEPMQAPNIAKFGRQILLALKALRQAGVPSMGGHLHSGNVLVSEEAFALSIGISDLENVILGEPPSSRLFLDACMKRILGSVDPKAASLTMDWSPLDVDVLCFGAIVFELAAGHIMASPAMHESHLPSWTSPHIRVMLGSIFNAHGASDMPTVDDLLILPFFAEKAEEIVPQGDSGRGLSLEGQQMLQNLMLESSNRFSRGAKKQPIKGSFGALLSLEDKQRAASSAKAGKVGHA